MSKRLAYALLSAAALTVPAIALAEVGPHSTWYAVHKHENGLKNTVNIVVQRNTGRADVNGVNYCLGKAKFPGGNNTAYPGTFDAYPVAVKHNKINYHGPATVYVGATKTTPTLTFTATISPKKAVGKFSLSATKCGTIHFTAPVALVRK